MSNDKSGEIYEYRRGVAILHDPRANKGTAFTEEERRVLGLQGLLPPRIMTQEQQQLRVMQAFRGEATDLDKYVYLTALQDRNETLFYRTVMNNVAEMLPIIYTPTVGEGCKEFGHIYRRPRGLYISYDDKGNIESVLRNWPDRNVAVIVVTDGERILGLGDLGANGMGIPIGKLSLYTALAGVPPSQCLPITLDVGTNNTELLENPLYIGCAHERIRGEGYDEFIEEFVEGVKKVFPKTILQFEDFAVHNALRLLAKYRDRARMFNDDIQGTAAVTLAGLLSAGRITGRQLTEQKVLFFGAGSAATGIGHLIVSHMKNMGMDHEEAMSRVWFQDSKGLVVRSRDNLADHKLPFAHEGEFVAELRESIAAVQPTALIGVSGQGSHFTHSVVGEMGRINERPVIFALSNPTSKSECTAEEAYTWTDGRVVFASGSPFDPVEVNGRRFIPGQGNNAYIFPGVGLGVMATAARHVTDEMFGAAATTLADFVTEEDLASGCLFPPMSEIREVSAAIAAAVAQQAIDAGLAEVTPTGDLVDVVRAMMYQPDYPKYA